MSVAEALFRLLRHTGLRAVPAGTNAWRIERAPNRADRRTRPSGTTESIKSVVSSPIIVTATKRDLQLGSVPDAVAVIALDPVDAVQPQNGTGYVAETVDGVSLAGLGPGRNRLFLRGVADSAFGGVSQSTVAIVFDETRLTYEAPDPDIRLVDVSKVEVLKGPQGSLYGTGALGGVYHIVSNRPGLEQSQFIASVGGGLVADGGVSSSSSAIVNLPVLPGTAAVRMVAYADQSAGWIDTGNLQDTNRSSVVGLRAALGIEPGNRWRVDASGLAQWINSRDSSYVYSPANYSRPAQLREPQDNDLIHGALSLTHKGALDLTLSTGYTHHAVDDAYDATLGAAGLGVADPQRLIDTATYSVWDSEARLTNSSGPINWLIGLSHLEARHRGAQQLQGTGGSIVVDAIDRTSLETALFGEASGMLVPRVQLSLGLRASRNSLEEELTAFAQPVDYAHSRWALTPSAALAYTAGTDSIAYVRYGSAFRQGGISSSASGASVPLDGDELATLESGWRQRFGLVTTSLDLYHSWWSSIQSDRLLPGGIIATINAGTGAITGAELSAMMSPLHGWSVAVGTSLQSALLVRNDTGLLLDDRRLPVVPSLSSRFEIARKITLRQWDLNADLRLNYVGPARLSFDTVLDRSMGDTLSSSMGISAARGALALSFKLDNVFGARSDSFAYGNPLRIFTARQYVPQAPTSFRFTLSYRH